MNLIFIFLLIFTKPLMFPKLLASLTFLSLLLLFASVTENDPSLNNIQYQEKVNGNWEVFGFHGSYVDIGNALQQTSIPYFPTANKDQYSAKHQKDGKIVRSNIVLATVHFFPPFLVATSDSSSSSSSPLVHCEGNITCSSSTGLGYPVERNSLPRYSTTPHGSISTRKGEEDGENRVLSVTDQNRLLETYRSALLHGSPWVVLTGTTWKDCAEQLEFLLESPDVPLRLFPDSVIRELEEESESDSEKVLLAKRLRLFFSVFSTSLGSWIDERDHLDAFDALPVLKSRLIQKRDYISTTRAELNKNVKEVHKEHLHRLSMLFALISSSPGEEQADWSHDSAEYFQYWKPSSDGETLLHSSAELEQLPRYTVLDGAPMILPGVITVVHPNIFHRMDLVTDALVSVWVLKEVKAVMATFGEHHAKGYDRLREGNPYSPARSKAKPVVQVHFGRDSAKTILWSNEFFDAALQHSLAQSKIVVGALETALNDDDSVVGRLSKKVKKSLMGNLLAATKRWDELMRVEYLYKISSPPQREHGWKDTLRLMWITHFRTVEASTPGFPALSSRLTRVAHYLSSWPSLLAKTPYTYQQLSRVAYDLHDRKLTLKAVLWKLLGRDS